MSDIFQRNQYHITRPITADMVYIDWGGQFHQATNLNVQYQQQVTRRYTLSSAQNTATIYPGRPVGNLTIQRLISNYERPEDNIFTREGFNVCSNPTDIHIHINGTSSSIKDCVVKYGSYIARGCYVTGYTFAADADSLSVVDNITVEFLQLDFDPVA